MEQTTAEPLKGIAPLPKPTDEQTFKVVVVNSKSRHVLHGNGDIACGSEIGPKWQRIVTMTGKEVLALPGDQLCKKCRVRMSEGTVL